MASAAEITIASVSDMLIRDIHLVNYEITPEYLSCTPCLVLVLLKTALEKVTAAKRHSPGEARRLKDRFRWQDCPAAGF